MCEKPGYKELEQRCKILKKKFAQRQQAEEELLELEKRHRDLFDNINDLIMIHDLKGRLLNVNPAVSKLSGYTFEELIGRPISDFIFPEFRSLFQDEYLKEIKKQGHSEAEFSHSVCPDCAKILYPELEIPKKTESLRSCRNGHDHAGDDG